jgi:hypothetical protein
MNLNNIRVIWRKYDFLITIGISILLIIVLALTRIGRSGSYSSNGDYSYLFTRDAVPQSTQSTQSTQSKSKDSAGETECRRVLEQIFKKPFNKDRPNFLKNNVNTGANLELDCVNYDIGLACEYNGAQHYKYIPHFHKNKEAFLNQKYRDEMKRNLCEKNNIKLIEVPYTIKVSDIQQYIIRDLQSKNFSF